MTTASKRALIAVSSYNDKFYDDGGKTGLFYGEASVPYYLFKEAGFEVDFASESGFYGIDEHSLNSQFLTEEELKDANDPNSDFNKALKRIKKASEIDCKVYSIFFAAGGSATLFDYPGASDLQRLASEIYDKGGAVAAVCHGPSIFANVKDKMTGKPLVQGRRITGFTDLGEEQLHLTEIIKRRGLKTCETIAKDVGAQYVAPEHPFDEFSVIDGRVVTGCNPASAHLTAVYTLKVAPCH
jgi:putative intracellular protease/amidase